MKQKRLLPLLAAVATMASCVDNNYDMSDIDMTVSSNVDLIVPAGSTGEIILKNIMDLKEDGVVQVVPDPSNDGDSIFVVKEDGDADIAPISIAKIRVKKPTIDPFSASVDLRAALGMNAPAKQIAGRRNLKITIPIMGIPKEVELRDTTFFYDIKEGDARQTLTGAKASGISTDVLSIRDISIDEVEVRLQLSISGFPKYIPYMHLDNLELFLPKDLHIKSCTLQSGKNTPVPAKEITEGKIQLTDKIDLPRPVNDAQVLTLVIDKANIATAPITDNQEHSFVFTPSTHSAELSGNFDVMGTFRLETSEMDGAEMEKVILAEIPNWDAENLQKFLSTQNLTMVSGLIPATLAFKGEASFNNDIVINSVSGSFMHEVGKIKPIKLDNLPDFLNDDEVVLDLQNPMIKLNINNAFPATIKTSMSIVGKEAGKTTVEKNAALEILHGWNYWYLADHKETMYLSKEEQAKYKHIKVEKLGDLLKDVPDEIEPSISTVYVDAENLLLGTDYDIDVHYDVLAPLAFTDEFKLVYQDTESGFNLNLDDVDISNATLSVDFKVSSNLPANISLTLIPLNSKEKEITEVKQILVNIPANANNKAVKVNIEAKSGHDLSVLFKGANKLDGIKYKAVIENYQSDKALPHDVKIKLTDVKIHIKGGVTYEDK